MFIETKRIIFPLFASRLPGVKIKLHRRETNGYNTCKHTLTPTDVIEDAVVIGFQCERET